MNSPHKSKRENLEEDKERERSCGSPFEDCGQKEQENGSSELPVEDEDEAIHSSTECGLGEQVHAPRYYLDQDNEHIWIFQSHFALSSLYIHLTLRIQSLNL